MVCGLQFFCIILQKFCQNCKYFWPPLLLILSYPSMESKWVTKEVDFAICENKPIIPFHIDDSKLNKTFQLYLNNVQQNLKTNL